MRIDQQRHIRPVLSFDLHDYGVHLIVELEIGISRLSVAGVVSRRVAYGTVCIDINSISLLVDDVGKMASLLVNAGSQDGVEVM